MPATQLCTISGQPFITRDEDIEFYRKISPVIRGKMYLIPPPKLCPQERERRRLTYRNECKLYRHKSALSNQPIISFYHPDSPWIVYSAEEWWSDCWNPLSYGRNFDFSRGFFEQFYELQCIVPRPPLINNKAENSDFCNFADGNKNCYLLSSANRNRDSYYGFFMINCTDCVDCTMCTKNELLYECIECNECYDLNYSQNCEGCAFSMYLFNCRGVKNCLFCINLMNKEQYYILNKSVPREEYEKTRKRINEDREYHQSLLNQFKQLKMLSPMKSINIVSCENVIGDNIYNSKDIYYGFVIYDSENCAYLHEGLKATNCHDICFFENCQLCYESTSLIGYGYRFTNFCRDSSDLWYCDNCHSCRNCFGCIGLRRKEYCILNKQYSKEAYEDLMASIIVHMDRRSEWGEFFPSRYSFFSYNETLAQDYFPLSKEQALAKGYQWREQMDQ